MGGRSSLAAAILVVGALLVLIVPSVLLTTNLVESATQLAEKVEAGTLEVPPPPAGVADWPIVGDRSTPSGRRLRGISTRRSIRSTRS